MNKINNELLVSEENKQQEKFLQEQKEFNKKKSPQEEPCDIQKVMSSEILDLYL